MLATVSYYYFLVILNVFNFVFYFTDIVMCPYVEHHLLKEQNLCKHKFRCFNTLPVERQLEIENDEWKNHRRQFQSDIDDIIENVKLEKEVVEEDEVHKATPEPYWV